MPGPSSQRPFLPPQFMNPMMGGMSFPLGGGNKLPSNPNPLAKPAPSHTVKADASGIQQAMAKRAFQIPPEISRGIQEKYDSYANRGKGARMGMLSGLGTGVGGLLGGLHGLARDPGEDEEGEPKSRLMNALKGTLGGGALGGFSGAAGSALLNGVPDLGKMAKRAARCWEGYEPVPGKEPYSDDSCRPKGSKKKNQKKANYRKSVTRNSLPFTLGGAAIGGGLVEGGVTEALTGGADEEEKEAAQDCDKPRLSSAGENSGVSYKIDDEGSLTGADAFKTLDGYMKKAGLNDFQSQFFSRLIQAGFDHRQIQQAVKQANARFGATISDELTVGLEKIAVVWPVLKAIGQGAVRAGSKIRGGFNATNKGVATASNAAWNAPSAALNSAKNTAARAGKTRLAQGIASNPYAQHTGRAIKNTVTDSNQLAHTGLGALTGAVNPYTGALSESAFNGDGSYNWQNVARSTLGGAIGGRLSGAMGNRIGSQFGRDAMTRGLAGESIGGAVGGLGGLAGYDIDANRGAQLGFGAGAATRLLPQGMGGKAVGNLIDKVDPNQMAVRAAKAAIPWAKKNPRDAMLGVGGGGSALAAGGTAANTAMNLQRDIPVLVNEKINTLGTELSNKVDDYAKAIVPQAQQTMNDLSEASRGVSNLTGGSNGNWMHALFGGGESGGGGGMLGGMMGGVGDYVQKNPWLIPLLLSGLGAGGGYAMGGGGGAALGGVAAPLLYMLATGQMGNQNQQFGQHNAASTAEIQRQANENAKVTQDMQDPVAPVQQSQVPQVNEIERQQKQQLAGAQG